MRTNDFKLAWIKGRYQHGLLLFCLIGLATETVRCQTTMNGNLTSFINDIIDEMPDDSGNEYTDALPDEYLQWEEMVTQLLNHNFGQTTALADALDYSLIEFTDDTDLFYILKQKETSNKYWGTYVYNPNSCRDIVIQSPHPKFEFNTGKQGIYVFQHTGARFFCLSGTHRCNQDAYSSCSGTTGTCGVSGEAFRISDLAHNTNAIFQASTEALNAFDENLVFIQLHGFTKQEDDPFLILSNGTQITPEYDPIDQLKNALSLIDDTLDFKIAHQDLDWTRLRGFTNVQGRHVNISTDDCNENATQTIGRFIHIEQEKTRLRQDSSKWDKMVVAINNTFDCLKTNVYEDQTDLTIKVFPNPASHQVYFQLHTSSTRQCRLNLFNAQGILVRTVIRDAGMGFSIDRNGLPAGIYHFKIFDEEKIYGNGKILFK